MRLVLMHSASFSSWPSYFSQYVFGSVFAKLWSAILISNTGSFSNPPTSASASSLSSCVFLETEKAMTKNQKSKFNKTEIK